MNDLEKRLSIIEEKLGIVNGAPKLEVGKWYLYSGHLGKFKPLMCITSISEANARFIGFDYNGKWTDSDFYPLYELDKYGYIEATNEEVVEALIEEAKRRGYKEGVKVKTFISSRGYTLTHAPLSVGNEPYNGGDYFGVRMGGACIYANGTWCEIIEEEKFDELKEPQQSSLEQDIQQLVDKYKQYKFTITIEDNI